MSELQKCARCGAEISRPAPGGHCLRCVLELALTEDDDPLSSDDVAAFGASPANAPPKPAAPGDRIGRYRLVEQIGKGGFGVVFKAEQEEPIRRFVALKVIKLGMDTQQVIARFEAERQALALMDHPNIAKVLDAGADAAGRPYFVMELVPGAKITDYCDGHKLSLHRRLALFMQVCQAIQHAHQKGVIHRDIKPSNILVSEADGVPVPKVIDFGIARATQAQRLTEETLSTAWAQFLGTPAYMSPEQAGLGGQDIDSRSDIYSLGMLLYELLTAQPAFDAETLREAALDEVLRFIREEEPPRPSARLTTLTPAELDTVAQCRQAQPAHLPNLLRGDLDWIVMRAVEKDRSRRYETAYGLALDIQRYLDHEPVLARPQSQLYRFQKVVRRNRLAFAAAGMVLAALIVGLGLSTWLFLREKAARQRAVAAEATARTEAAKSAQVAGFLKQMLKGVGPAVAKGRDTKLLREILDNTARAVSKDLTAQPEVEAELRSTLGGVYAALGDYGTTESMHRAALALRRTSNPESLKVADSLNDLANVFYRQGKMTNAESTHREALALRRKLLGPKNTAVAESLSNLANVLWAQGRLHEAESMHREALAMRRELLGNDDADTAASLGNLADVLSLEGKLQEGEAMQRESLEMTKRALGNDHPDVAIALNDLADMLLAAGKLSEAEATNRAVLALRLKLFGQEHPDVAFSLFNLANVLAAEGKLSEGEAMHRQALAMRRRILSNDHPDVAGSLNNLAGVLIAEGKFGEAETAQREALAIQRKILPGGHEDIAGSLDNIAKMLWCQGRLPEADATFREALAMQRKLFGEAHADIALTLHDLADVLLSEGKLSDAEAMHREALAMRRKILGDEHPDVAVSLNSLAAVLKEQGKLAEAETTLREALAMRQKLVGSENPAVAESLSDLAGVLEREGKLAEAETVCREALALREKKLPDDWVTFDTRSQLGGILAARTNYAEATPLLLSGYAGMKQHEAAIPVPNRSHLKEALQRLVRLYEATGNSAQAAAWRQKLETAQY